MGLLKIDWSKKFDVVGEWVLIVFSFPIWFPISCYKYGLVKSDNIIKKYIND